jgi:transcriptional regulator with XRE-family HTH domain
MATTRSPLGTRIREARTAKGWKQKHLAAEVAVEPMTVSRWERGATQPDLDVVRLIAEATGKPVSFFVAGDDEVDPGSVHALERVAGRLEAAAARTEAAVDRFERLLASAPRGVSTP